MILRLLENDVGTHRYAVIGAQKGYSRLQLHWRPRDLVHCLVRLQQSPLVIQLVPKIYLHKRTRLNGA